MNEPRGKTVLIESTMFSRYECQTDDEAIERLANDLKEAKAKLDKLTRELTIDDIKKMNWREFKKWKRG